MSAANAGKVWIVRTMGERRYKALLLELASASRLSRALAGALASASFIILLGAVLLFLYPDPAEDWGFWFSLGLIAYGVVVAFYGSLWLLKLFKEASSNATPSVSANAAI